MPAEDTELVAREKIATACRILAREGVSRAGYGHVSVRMNSGRILIKSRGAGEEGLEFATRHDVIEIDPAGDRVHADPVDPAEPDDLLEPPSEKHIHLALYRARPDVRCVVHAHPACVVALTATNRPLVPLYSSYDPVGLSVLLDGLAYFPRSALICTPELGDELAVTIGSGSGCLMRGHGIVVVGATVEEAIARTVALNELVRVNWMAYAVGTPEPVDDEAIAFYAERAAWSRGGTRFRNDGVRTDWYYFQRRVASGPGGSSDSSEVDVLLPGAER